MPNLYLSVLRALEVERESFSDSTGTLSSPVFTRCQALQSVRSEGCAIENVVLFGFCQLPNGCLHAAIPPLISSRPQHQGQSEPYISRRSVDVSSTLTWMPLFFA